VKITVNIWRQKNTGDKGQMVSYPLDDVEELEDRGVRRHPGDLVADHLAGARPVLLPPDVEREVHL
jgi:hypothetical protein